MRPRALRSLAVAALFGLTGGVAVWVGGLAARPGRDSAWPSQAELDQIRAVRSCPELVHRRDVLAFKAMQAIGRANHASANHDGTLANEADATLRARGCNPDGSPRVRGGTTTSVP